MQTTKLIEHLKNQQPAIWMQLRLAATEGYVVIDKETDSITASNWLLLAYPGLHEVLSRIVSDWQNKTHPTIKFSALMENKNDFVN